MLQCGVMPALHAAQMHIEPAFTHQRPQAFGTEMTLDPLLMRLNQFTSTYDLDSMIDNLYKVGCSDNYPADMKSQCLRELLTVCLRGGRLL